MTSMIDKALNTLPQESYYFQLLPVRLRIISNPAVHPAPGTTYSFEVFKGMQKFDQNKIPVVAEFGEDHSMYLPKFALNFYIPTVTKGRKVEFVLKLFQREEETDFSIGELVIQFDPIIASFKDEKNSVYFGLGKVGEDYQIEYQGFVEKSRFALEKTAKEYITGKSPAVKSSINPRDDKSPKQSNVGLRSSKKEAKSQVKEQEQIQTPLKNQHDSNHLQVSSQRTPSAVTNSKSAVPLLVTRHVHQVADPHAKHEEVGLKGSIRIGSGNISETQSKHKGQDWKQIYGIWAFLALSFVWMYFAMQPTRKV